MVGGPKLPKPWLVRRIEELHTANTPRPDRSRALPAHASLSAERTVCNEAGTDQSGHVKVMSSPRPLTAVVMTLLPRGKQGSSGTPRNASHSKGASTRVSSSVG